MLPSASAKPGEARPAAADRSWPGYRGHMGRVTAPALAAALALGACTPGVRRVPSRPPSPPAATSTVPTATPTATRTGTPVTAISLGHVVRTGREGRHRWTAQYATVRGLGSDGGRLNGALEAATDAVLDEARRAAAGVGEPATTELVATLDTVDAYYVSVRLTVTSRIQGTAQPYAYVRTLVHDRARGALVGLDSWFHRAALTGALEAMSGYLRERVPVVLGRHDWNDEGLASKPANFREVVPLPEGLEVTFGSLQVSPDYVGLPRVTVPWHVLAPYLALDPPPGERTPPYRDGVRLTGAELRAAERAVERVPAVRASNSTYTVQRVQRTQHGSRAYVLATVVFTAPGHGELVVALEDGAVAGTARDACPRALPAAVRRSAGCRA